MWAVEILLLSVKKQISKSDNSTRPESFTCEVICVNK